MTALLESGSERTIYLKAPKFNPLMGLLGFLYLITIIINIWVYIEGKRLDWEFVLIPAIPFVFYYIVFSGWRVEITPEKITVVTFFWFRKAVERSAITGWSDKNGWKAGERLSTPYNRVEIRTTKNMKPFVIPTKPLRYKDYQTLLSLLPADMRRNN
jgi:hypothetical protein